MSVRTNQYVIYGVRLDYDSVDKFWYDKYEDYIDSGYGDLTEKNGLTVIFDGMNGHYIFIGKVIARSDIDEPLYGVTLLEPPATPLGSLIYQYFGVEDPDPKLWLVTHYH